MPSVETVFDERVTEAGLTVNPELKSRLLTYYELLAKWNQKINLTALSEPAAAIDRLLIEPLSAASDLPSAAPMADLGSGGGSPAIPLALALGAPWILMVESRSRKAAFLREAAREVNLNAVVEAVRFEELAVTRRHDGTAGLVTMRAITPDNAALSLARQLSRKNAVVAVFATQDGLPSSPLGLVKRSTWNIQPSGMLITFHVEHD